MNTSPPSDDQRATTPSSNEKHKLTLASISFGLGLLNIAFWGGIMILVRISGVFVNCMLFAPLSPAITFAAMLTGATAIVKVCHSRGSSRNRLAVFLALFGIASTVLPIVVVGLATHIRLLLWEP